MNQSIYKIYEQGGSPKNSPRGVTEAERNGPALARSVLRKKSRVGGERTNNFPATETELPLREDRVRKI